MVNTSKPDVQILSTWATCCEIVDSELRFVWAAQESAPSAPPGKQAGKSRTTLRALFCILAQVSLGMRFDGVIGEGGGGQIGAALFLVFPFERKEFCGDGES